MRSAPRRRWLVVSVAGAMAASVAAAATPLPRYGAVPDFAVTDHTGHPLTRQMLDGVVWVADFIFTRCAGQCPMLSERMQRLQRAFADQSQFRLVSFSVDPAYDTPDVLRPYAARVGAETDRWRFATGAPEAMTALIQRGFRLAVGQEGTPEEPLTHSVRLVLVDAHGAIRGYYDANDDAAMQRLVDDARTLLRE